MRRRGRSSNSSPDQHGGATAAASVQKSEPWCGGGGVYACWGVKRGRGGVPHGPTPGIALQFVVGGLLVGVSK